MKLFQLALTLVLSSFAAAELRGRQATENEIVGGSTAAAPSYFVHFGDRSCGASLITGDIVLTAAHCVASGFPSSVVIQPSTHTSAGTTDGLTVTVDTANSISHPSYNGNVANGFDVAIVKLSSAVSTSTYPVITLNQNCLLPNNGDTLAIYGYGLTSSGGSQPDNLQTLNTNFQCASSTDEYIALFASSSTGACFGDSGGPAIIGAVQFGLSSFVVGDCAAGNFDGYARVSTYYSWIEEQVCARGSDTTNFSCNSFAQMKRAAADSFSKAYFGAQSSVVAVATAFGYGKTSNYSKDDFKPFPMGP